MVEGLSFRKMSMTVFCGLMQKGLKATEHMKKFQLNNIKRLKKKKKGKSFLSWAIQRQSRQCEKTESQFMQRVDNT